MYRLLNSADRWAEPRLLRLKGDKRNCEDEYGQITSGQPARSSCHTPASQTRRMTPALT